MCTPGTGIPSSAIADDLTLESSSFLVRFTAFFCCQDDQSYCPRGHLLGVSGLAMSAGKGRPIRSGILSGEKKKKQEESKAIEVSLSELVLISNSLAKSHF